MRLYTALAWMYRLLLYLAVPYIAVTVENMPITQVPLLLAMLFYVDTVAEAAGWAIYREGEYEPLLGCYALYMFTSVFVLLALLVAPYITMVYLPIVGLLGALALVGKHGVPNRKFSLAGTLAGALTMLAAMSLFTIPIAAALASIVLPLVLILVISHREEIPPETRLATCVKLGVAIGVAMYVTLLSIADVFKMTVTMIENAHMLMLDTSPLVKAPNIFMTALLYAFPEEFIGRAFIPYVGAGLANYVFVTLHIPKLAYAMTILCKYYGTLLTGTMLVSAGAWLTTASIVLTWTWRRAGLLGSALAHALTNTIILLLASGQSLAVVAMTLALSVAYYITQARER